MRPHTLLCILCFTLGCNAVGPMPGHLTQNVNQDQMSAMLETHLKPGMPMTEAQAFLQKEEFTYGYKKQHMTGSEAVKFTRNDPIDFWTDQTWVVTLEGSQGKLVRYQVKSETEKPSK